MRDVTDRVGAGKKIITIGEILVEIMADEAGQGFLSPIALTGPYPSGAPAIFIDQVGRLGQPCGIVSAVGDDDFGRVNLDRLTLDGVDISAVRVDPDRPTGSAFVRYRRDGQRDFVFNIKHSACGAIVRTAAVDALLASADHLHVMGTALVSPVLAGLIEDALASLKARGGSVSFDPNLRKEVLAEPGIAERLERVLAQTDVFLPSGPELLLFSRATDESGAVADILTRGVASIVLKRGAQGATYFDVGCRVDVPGFGVEEIDPTGAGDCFGATFVTQWLRGAAPSVALGLANAAGARAVTFRGPMEGNANAATLQAFIQDHGYSAS